MGLGETRKILSVLLSVLLAFSFASLITAMALNTTVTKQAFLEKYFITDELVQECTAQLDAKYEVLSAETGIPQRVFVRVKDDYKVSDSLHTALQNAFGAEDTGLYNSNMVNYFTNLCTEYLDDSGVTYDEQSVAKAADEAAIIFSETVGMHRIDSLSANIRALKKAVTTVMATSAFSTVLFGVLIFMLFNNRKKAAVYALAGVCGGSLGVALGCIGCMVFKTASLLQLSPPIYQAAAEALAGKLLGLTAGGAAVLFAVGYIVLIYTYKTAERKSKRNMIF